MESAGTLFDKPKVGGALAPPTFYLETNGMSFSFLAIFGTHFWYNCLYVFWYRFYNHVCIMFGIILSIISGIVFGIICGTLLGGYNLLYSFREIIASLVYLCTHNFDRVWGLGHFKPQPVQKYV